ncbi:MAG: elongation factor G [Thermodesulfobacteriota bacterium]
MTDLPRESIRNLAIIGNHGEGKTSVAEAMLFLGGATDKLGSVDNGSSTLEYELEEKNRRMSINSHIAFYEWNNHLVNIIDTPGFMNFLYETASSLKVVDSAIVMLNAVPGVRTQVGKFWQMASEQGIPKLLFINKLDKERSSFENAIAELGKDIQARIIPLTIPIGKEQDFTGVVDLIELNAHIYGVDGKDTIDKIPSEMEELAKGYRERIIEAVAELDDELLEKYLEGETLGNEVINNKLREGVLSSKVVPLYVGSATKLIGINIIMDGINRFLPSPIDRRSLMVKDIGGEDKEVFPKLEEATSAYVFKTISDPYAGKISVFRIFSGELKSESNIYISNSRSREKIGQLYRIIGKKQLPVNSALFGDIVTVNKLKNIQTGETISDMSKPVVIPPVTIPQAVMSYAIQPKSRSDEDKLMPSLHRIKEEDPTISFRIDDETKEFLISGTGQTHVEVVVEKLKHTYGVNVELQTPKVPYRETIKGSAKAEGKYIKQTGGRGQYGDAWLDIEPLPRGKDFEFVDKIVGGAIPRNFIPSVEKGVREALKKGVLAGYPVMDVKVTLFDGKYHTVDSSDIAFQIAGSMGFKKAMEAAHPVLLEPVMRMEIFTPEDSVGDVIGDVNSRRGKVLGVEPQAPGHLIKALLPMGEVLTYAPELRSITSGRGSFTQEFDHYEEVPSHIANKIIVEANKEGGSEA